MYQFWKDGFSWHVGLLLLFQHSSLSGRCADNYVDFYSLASMYIMVQFSRSVMSNSRKPIDCSTPDFLSITNSWSLLKLMSIESVMPSGHLVLCCPLLLSSISPSIRVFSNELVLRIIFPRIFWKKLTNLFFCVLRELKSDLQDIYFIFYGVSFVPATTNIESSFVNTLSLFAIFL